MLVNQFSKLSSKSSNLINKNNLHTLNTAAKLVACQLNAVTSINKVQKRNASAFKFVPDTAPASLGETTKMNLCQSITNALDIALSADKTAGS